MHMTEQTKAILATITIVACLALLAFLVHEKVDGATVAALSTVAVLVAYFTRAPERKDPPTGPGIVVFAGIVTTVLSLFACSPHQAAATAAEAAYRAQQMDCVRQYDTEAQVNECRHAVNKAWGIVEVAAKDAGAE